MAIQGPCPAGIRTWPGTKDTVVARYLVGRFITTQQWLPLFCHLPPVARTMPPSPSVSSPILRQRCLARLDLSATRSTQITGKKQSPLRRCFTNYLGCVFLRFARVFFPSCPAVFVLCASVLLRVF